MLLSLFFLENRVCLNCAKSLIIVNKPNNICKKIRLCNGALFFIKLDHSSYNVNKPQVDSFKTIQFSYF